MGLMGFRLRTPAVALAAFCLCPLLLLSACTGGSTQDPRKLSAKHNQAFASAEPQTKAMWDMASDAIKTNGYVVAMQALQALVEQTNITPAQVTAAQVTVTAVSDKMYAAANSGDAAAQEAIQELRKIRSR